MGLYEPSGDDVSPILEEGIRQILDTNLGVRNGERMLVLSDVPLAEDWSSQENAFLEGMVDRIRLAQMMRDVAAARYPDSLVRLICYARRPQSGADLDDATTSVMLDADVILAPTTYSMTHTKARELACASGARVASMPGIVTETLLPGGPLFVDYDALRADTEALAVVLSNGAEAVLTCPRGTNLRLGLGTRTGHGSIGLIRRPGEWGNIPSGEASIAPIEDSAEGCIVVQQGWFPHLEVAMRIEFVQGRLTVLQGGGHVGAMLHHRLLEPSADERRRLVAELGIGANPRARQTDVILEAEKIRGTVHVAVGNSYYLGGGNQADLHIDFVIPEPTFWVDGRLVVENGALSIDR